MRVAKSSVCHSAVPLVESLFNIFHLIQGDTVHTTYWAIMSDNPYEAPKEGNEHERPARPPKLDANTKEFLGIAKDDFWYYPGFVLLVVACFFTNVLLVLVLFAISTAFLLIFLVKSFPKYIHSHDLAAFTKVFGIIGNLALIALQIVVVVAKSWVLLS